MFFRARLEKKIANFVLDVFIEINKHEYTMMLGPSGAGKSMTLKIIAGIESSIYQDILIDGVNISSFPPEKRNIVYLPQKNSLFPHMNVFKNVIFPFLANKRSIDKDLVERVIETFKIGDLLKRMPKNLSGGEARRVALARAICAKPKLLLLDEPLTSLDFYMKLQLIEFFKKLTKEYSVTVLHVTHDPIETYMLAQRILFIRSGRIIAIKNLTQEANFSTDDIKNLIKKLLYFPQAYSF